MDLTSILGIASAATGGGVLGVVGGLFTKGLEAYNKKKDLEHDLAILTERNSHEIAMQDKAKEFMVLEYQQKSAIALTEAETAETSASMNAMVASFSADKATYATGKEAANSAWFVFVDVVRGLIRPLLTVYLDVVLTYYGWLLHNSLSKSLLVATDNDQVMLQILMQIVEALVFMSTTATMWWFAARGIKPPKSSK